MNLTVKQVFIILSLVRGSKLLNKVGDILPENLKV